MSAHWRAFFTARKSSLIIYSYETVKQKDAFSITFNLLFHVLMCQVFGTRLQTENERYS